MTDKPMTADEYEDRKRRLKADIDEARTALQQAQARFDDLCDQSRDLTLTWREQKED